MSGVVDDITSTVTNVSEGNLAGVNYVLVGVLVVMLVFAIRGLIKGFVETAFRLVSVIVVIVVTLALSSTVTSHLAEIESLRTGIYNMLDEKVNLDSFIGTDKSGEDVVNALEMPEVMKKIVIRMGGDELDSVIDTTELEAKIVNAGTQVILNVLGFLITFIATSLILFIICKILNVISLLPGLKELNKLLGAVVGLLEGVVVVWILFAVFTLFASTSWGLVGLDYISQSNFLTNLYSKNVILNLIVYFASKMLA